MSLTPTTIVPVPTPIPPSPAASKLKATHHLSSGALSGLVSAVLLQPLDLLKTRLQQSYVDADAAARGKVEAGGVKR
jgi:solute carrier family 25 protein 38